MRKIFALLFCVASMANVRALPINCMEDHCFSAGVEYLYLKPTVYDPYFLIPEGGPGSTNEPRGTRFANELEYHSGVRGWAAYGLPCFDRLDAFVEGMYISDDHKRRIDIGTEGNPPLALGTKGNPHVDLNSVENATSKIDYQLWNLKGGVNYCFCAPCPLLAAAHLNVHYVNVKLDEVIFYDETGNVVCLHIQSDSWGIGPELGLDVGYRFFPCLSLVARGAGALLVTHHDSRTHEFDVVPAAVMDNVLAENEGLYSVQPYLELKVGLNLATCFCGFNFEAELGFDALRYTDILDTIRWVGDREQGAGTGFEGASLDYFSPFMLHGLYANIGITF